MKLIETRFDNFRCFKQYDLKYAPETTVFIGKNGTGKSSVLSGIRRGLSFMFAKPKNYKKNLAISNNAKVRSYGKDEANFDAIERVYNYPINNSFKASFIGRELNWEMVKRTQNGGYASTYYKDVVSFILDYYNSVVQAQLPLLAVITDSYPHQMVNLGTKVKKIINSDILPRDLAYYGWDERTNCIELWLTRFYKVSDFEKDLNDEIRAVESQIRLWEARLDFSDETDNHNSNSRLSIKNIQTTISRLNERLRYLHSDERSEAFNKERLFIENKLFEFTKPVSDDFNFINKEFELFRIAVNRLDKKNYTLEFNFKDGRVITFESLPMGYRRVFSMVIDIAYRSYILNQGIESEGVVLIDEIELHLHPTLQQDVLKRLRQVFPNIQFIVTTHSPLVISNFKSDDNNKIIKLEHDGNDYYNDKVENIYGIDYNTGLTEIMGAKYRETELEKLIDSIVILTKFGKTEQANKIKEELIDIAGENNKYLNDEINKRLKQNSKAN
ncbi:AAA family ATPase [Elizabethkingia anophelis]|uniref:AAA family ATPase n=1 Tax=Elizabethkingia anophelis TaxID=1117645 RepID=UPI003891C4FD